MFVARNAQIVSVANIRSELEGVIAADFGPVVHKLILVLALKKRAIALIRTEGISHAKIGCVAVACGRPGISYKEWHSGRELVTLVQSGYAGVFRGCRAYTTRRHVNVIAHISKTK